MEVVVIADQFVHNYVVLPPTEADLTGFKVGGLMKSKRVISGSDLGTGDKWAITKKDANGVFTYQPLGAPHMVWVWSGKIGNLKTFFKPIRNENYQV
jgi:hypothetical protein